MENQRFSYRKNFNIDSDDRSNGDAENFNINLDIPYRNGFNTAVALSAEIDKSYYLLDDSTTNSFSCTSITTDDVNLTPNKDYDTAAWAIMVNAALNAATITGPFTTTYNDQTAKYTIENVTNTFSCDFTNSPEIAKYLGFSQAVNTATGSGPWVLTSSKIAKLNRYDVITIRSNICLNNNNPNLCFIYPNGYAFGETIRYECKDPNTASTGVDNIRQNNFNFEIVGDDGKVINLQGGSWRFILSLSYEKL